MAEYIEREALLDSICYETCGIAFCGATNCAFMAKVCSAPAADVAPVRHGHWIEGGDCQICSECGEVHCWDEYRAAYCDSCGAKMDGGDGNG